VLVKDSCTVCDKCTIGSEIVLDTLNAHLGDEAQLEARFGPFRDSANLDAGSVHGLRPIYHMLGNRFGRTQ
jgi:predicted DsbA family dithiol-disulfide isomerase